jgi:tetratricopeptide (TPR) repeat protein
VILALARWRYFPVVARGSVFAFKGRDVDPREVRRELGARYVVEGTIRRRDGALRLDAMLADAESATTLLSETFSAPIGAGELEDDIARGIVGALEPMLLRHETERAAHVGRDSNSAYTLFLRGLWHHYRYTEDDNARARALLGQALDIAPSYAKAMATLALAELMGSHYRKPGRDREALFGFALRHGEGAVRLDPADPTAHFARGTALLMGGHSLPEAEAALRRALALDPSYAAAHANLGSCCNGMDRPAEALESIGTALRLSPQDPRRFIWLAPKSIALYLSGDYAGAIGVAREVLALKRDAVMVLRPLVAALGQLGRPEAAAPFLEGLRQLDGGPEATERHLRTLYGPAALERLLEGLQRAGYS